MTESPSGATILVSVCEIGRVYVILRVSKSVRVFSLFFAFVLLFFFSLQSLSLPSSSLWVSDSYNSPKAVMTG